MFGVVVGPDVAHERGTVVGEAGIDDHVSERSRVRPAEPNRDCIAVPTGLTNRKEVNFVHLTPREEADKQTYVRIILPSPDGAEPSAASEIRARKKRLVAPLCNHGQRSCDL